ncbi:hypothetical protein [Alloprevotella tannerae]|jgi:transmembrane transport protein
MYKQVFLNFSFIITQESGSNILEDLFCLQLSIAFEKFQACGKKIPSLGTKVRCAWEKSPKPWEQIGTGLDEKRRHLLPTFLTFPDGLRCFFFYVRPR